MAAAAAASAGGNILGSIIQGGFGLGQQSMANSSAERQQNTFLDFQKSTYDRVESSFKEAGLPKFMAWTGGSSGQAPMTRYQVAGQNFYNSNIPSTVHIPSGTNTTFGGFATGLARPSNPRAESQSTQAAETARPGLGYNAVPPPKSLQSPNSGSVIFSGPNALNRSQGTQAGRSLPPPRINLEPKVQGRIGGKPAGTYERPSTSTAPYS